MGVVRMSKLGIGHGRLLIILGGFLARTPAGLSVIPGAERFCGTLLHVVAAWTVASFATALAYLGCRRLLAG